MLQHSYEAGKFNAAEVTLSHMSNADYTIQCNKTVSTDPAVLLPKGLWYKLDWKMSFDESWRGGEVFCLVNSYMRCKDGVINSLILVLNLNAISY